MILFNPQGGVHGLFVGQRQRRQFWPTWLALLAGGLQAASLAWPVAMPTFLQGVGWMQGQPLWGVQTLALAVLVYLLQDSDSARQAAWRGWLFAPFGWLALLAGCLPQCTPMAV